MEAYEALEALDRALFKLSEVIAELTESPYTKDSDGLAEKSTLLLDLVLSVLISLKLFARKFGLATPAKAYISIAVKDLTIACQTVSVLGVAEKAVQKCIDAVEILEELI